MFSDCFGNCVGDCVSGDCWAFRVGLLLIFWRLFGIVAVLFWYCFGDCVWDCVGDLAALFADFLAIVWDCCGIFWGLLRYLLGIVAGINCVGDLAGDLAFADFLAIVWNCCRIVCVGLCVYV